jgi:DNA-directed RNA polymerase subunit L
MMRDYMSFDPIEDHYRYANELGREAQIRDAIAIEMYDLKHDALERIDMVIHPEYAADFTKILQYALEEGLPQAKSIAKKMGLKQQHFMAIDGDQAAFKTIFIKDVFDRTGDVDRDYDMYVDKYL